MSKKRYIILLDNSTSEQDVKFLEWIKKIDLGWWHWLSNSWLIYDSYNKVDCKKIRDVLKDIYPGVHNVVFELSTNSDTWAGWGPSEGDGEKNNMFVWLKNKWKE